MLASVPRTDASDEVHLLATCVQPGPIEAELGPVRADLETEPVNVERKSSINVIDVDRHVMDSDRLYDIDYGIRSGRLPANPATPLPIANPLKIRHLGVRRRQARIPRPGLLGQRPAA